MAPGRRRDAYLSSVGLPISVCLIAVFAIVLFGRAFLERSESAFWGDALLVADVPVSVLRPVDDPEQPLLPLTGDETVSQRTGSVDAPFLPGTTVRLHGWEVTLGQPDPLGEKLPLTVVRISDMVGDISEIAASWVDSSGAAPVRIEELPGSVEPTQLARGTLHTPPVDGVLRLEIGSAQPVHFDVR